MNKSRRQLTQASEALVRAGYATLLPDLFGTGDSAGDFVDATWPIWQENIDSCISWCEQQGLDVAAVVGVRLGAILATETLREVDRAISATVLWQPVTSGQQFVTQLLRLRVAASLMADVRETSEILRARLAQNGSLEIAGYRVSGDLIRSIEDLRLETALDSRLGRLCILEIGRGQLRQMSRVGHKLLAVAEERGLDSCGESIDGEPLWLATEIVTNKELTEKTVEFLSEALQL